MLESAGSFGLAARTRSSDPLPRARSAFGLPNQDRPTRCAGGTTIVWKWRATVGPVSNRSLLGADAIERAVQAAQAAAVRSEVVVTELHEPPDFRAAAELFAGVWGTGPAFAPISPDLLRALRHTANYVAGAWRGKELVGASAGFFANGDGIYKLHSHITGLRPASQRHGVGFALKVHQRAWALQHDLPVITWTFDPLVRRNGFFNLTKLGADATGFYANFYGAMNDRVNADDESDRCEVTWDLRSDRAQAACELLTPEPDFESLLADGAVVALDDDGTGQPRIGRLEGEVRLCWVPPDILNLRATDPRTARAWRHALRATLGASIREGFVASGVTRSGWYVARQTR